MGEFLFLNIQIFCHCDIQGIYDWFKFWPELFCRISSECVGLVESQMMGSWPSLLGQFRGIIIDDPDNIVRHHWWLLRIQFKLNTALLSTCPSVTGMTSHISHIYKGINAMLIIRGPIKPYIFWIKIILAIFLAKTRPDKTIFSALTNLTSDFDFKLSKV